MLLIKQIHAAEQFRKRLLELTANQPKCGLLLSAGVDSNVILHALLENNTRPTIYSIRSPITTGSDWLHAKRMSEKYSLPFVDCVLPKDYRTLWNLVCETIEVGQLRKKTDIECGTVWRFAMDCLKQNNETVAWWGMEADHAQRKNTIIKGHKTNKLNNVEWFQSFVRQYLPTNGSLQTIYIQKYIKPLGITIHDPFLDETLLNTYKNFSWIEFHKPRQKMLMRLAFKQLKQDNATGMYATSHMNMQTGDSGIAELFGELVNTPINTKRYKSVVGMYNEYVRTIQAQNTP